MFAMVTFTKGGWSVFLTTGLISYAGQVSFFVPPTLSRQSVCSGVAGWICLKGSTSIDAIVCNTMTNIPSTDPWPDPKLGGHFVWRNGRHCRSTNRVRARLDPGRWGTSHRGALICDRWDRIRSFLQGWMDEDPDAPPGRPSRHTWPPPGKGAGTWSSHLPPLTYSTPPAQSYYHPLHNTHQRPASHKRFNIHL